MRSPGFALMLAVTCVACESVPREPATAPTPAIVVNGTAPKPDPELEPMAAPAPVETAAPASPLPTPPLTPLPIPKPPPKTRTTAKGCDEISCLVADKPPPCCDHIRRPPPGPRPPAPDRLTREDIMTVISKLRGAIQSCGEDDTDGTLKVKVGVAANGKVSNVTVLPPFDGTSVGQCVKVKLKTAAKFRATDVGGSFTFPFVFHPKTPSTTP